MHTPYFLLKMASLLMVFAARAGQLISAPGILNILASKRIGSARSSRDLQVRQTMNILADMVLEATGLINGCVHCKRVNGILDFKNRMALPQREAAMPGNMSVDKTQSSTFGSNVKEQMR